MSIHRQQHAVTSADDHTFAGNNKLLGSNGTAVPTEYDHTTTPAAGAIPEYDASNDLVVPTTPSSATAAASKAYVDSLTSGVRGPMAVLELVGAAATQPVGPAVNDCYVVSTVWGGFAVGDIVQWTTSWNLVLANSGGFVPSGTRVVCCGSTSTTAVAPFVGEEREIQEADGAGAWTNTAPTDGDLSWVYLGAQDGTQWIYDIGNDIWLGAGGGVASHNALSGLQGGTTAEYYHLTSAQHGLQIKQAADQSSAGYPTAATILAALGANEWCFWDVGTGTDYLICYDDGTNAFAVELSQV